MEPWDIIMKLDTNPSPLASHSSFWFPTCPCSGLVIFFHMLKLRSILCHKAGAVSLLSMDRLCFAPAISELSNATGLITQQPSLGVENALVGSAAHRSGLPSSRQRFCLA